MRHFKPLFFAASVVTLLAGTQAASAYDLAYCIQGRSWGYPGQCAFTSYQQCQTTASGTGSTCGINPRYAFAQQGRSYSDDSFGPVRHGYYR